MRNPEHECCKILINKFVNNPNWPRETKIAKKLLLLSPDIESWVSLNLPNKLPSLAFFLTEAGAVFVPYSQLNPFLLDLDKLRPKCKKSKKKIEMIVS